MASESSSTTSLPPSSSSERNITSLRKKVEDSEIDVFSADKYFSGVIDQEINNATVIYQQQEANSRKNQTYKAMISLSKMKLQPRTPSVHSESSWNSQSALLRPVQRNLSRNNNNHIYKEKKSSFLPCYCCDKKSVDINDQDEFDNHGSRSFNNENNRGITRRITTSFDTAEITRLKKLSLEEAERKRKKSLEVFGSNKDEERKWFSLDSKRPNMLSWDDIPRSLEEIATSGGPPSGTHNDTESEASSDLFEIECLSYNANPVVDQESPTTRYAPSEASIEWSVVTASAAGFSTVLDSEDQRSTVTRATTRPKTSPNTGSSVKTLMNKGILSGCKSQKAVMVAGDVYRSPLNKRKSGESHKKHRFSDSYTHATRVQVNNKLSRNGLSQSDRFSRF